jgi:hypothetical protein
MAAFKYYGRLENNIKMDLTGEGLIRFRIG